MKKYLATTLLLVMMMSLCLSSCATSKSYTFDIETGDRIEVELDTSNGLELTQEDGSFRVTKDKEDVISAIFLTTEKRNDYISIILEDPNAEITKNTNDEFEWTINGESGVEHNKIVSVQNTNKTYILLGSICKDYDLLEKAYQSLSFKTKN